MWNYFNLSYTCLLSRELVYQTIEGLHKACPNHKGDWYFSGKYPTPGGNRLVNKAFINFYEGRDGSNYGC